jgi:hypothetical protein
VNSFPTLRNEKGQGVASHEKPAGFVDGTGAAVRGDTFTGSSPLTVQVDAHLSGGIKSSDLDLATV